MNLPNHVENHENAFRYIVTATCLFVTIGTFVVYKYFRATGTFPKLFDLAYFNFGEWSKNY